MTQGTPSQDDAFEKIRKAVEARDAFLKEHPELQPLQDEITRLMRNMGSPHNRMALLDAMLRERVLDLQRKLVELREEILTRLADAQERHAAAQLEEAQGLDGPEAGHEHPEQSQGPEEQEEPFDQEDTATGNTTGKILGPADAWPVPDGLTGRDRPDRPPRGQPHRNLPSDQDGPQNPSSDDAAGEP
jgi:hypothetical protein